MNEFDRELRVELSNIRAQNLLRSLRRIDSAQGPRLRLDGRELLNFSSNDYLGLANDERVRQCALEAIGRYGVGSGASRLVCGSLAIHHQLETRLAALKHTEAALSFSSGYATAVGTIPSVVGKDDVVILDKRVHASIVDGAKLSGAKVRVFAHNDLEELEYILKWADGRRAGADRGLPGKRSRVLIVTESVFSMDGDFAALPGIVELKDRFGAWLMVDEAHATGLYGTTGGGLAEELGLSERIEIQMGTLGKALGSAGGFICGSQEFIEYLVNRARSFLFSTAPAPACAAAAMAAVDIVQSLHGQQLRRRLWQRVVELDRFLASGEREQCPIRPIIIGDEDKTMAAAADLFERGLFVPGIRFPSVARGQARLRVTITSAHTQRDVQTFGQAVAELARKEPPVLAQ